MNASRKSLPRIISLILIFCLSPKPFTASARDISEKQDNLVPLVAYTGLGGNIWLTDLEGNSPEAITTGGGYSQPQFSPDARKLVFVHEQHAADGMYLPPTEIIQYNLSTKIQSILVGSELINQNTPDRYYQYSYPSWSSDGKWLYFIADDGRAQRRIFRVDDVTGQKDSKYPFGSGKIFSLIISPSNGMMVTNLHDDLTGTGFYSYTQNGKDNGWFLSPESPLSYDNEGAFSPDGQTFAYLEGSNGLRLMTCPAQSCDKEQKTVTILTNEPYTQTRGLTWTPDGKGLIVSVNGQILQVLLTGKQESVIALGTDPAITLQEVISSSLSAIPPSNLIAFITTDREVATIAPDGTGLRIIAPLSDQYFSFSGSVWSPDGTRILYKGEERKDSLRIQTLYMYDIRTGKTEQILQETYELGELVYTWSPEGNYIAYSPAFDLIESDLPAPVFEPKGIWKYDLSTKASTPWIDGVKKATIMSIDWPSGSKWIGFLTSATENSWGATSYYLASTEGGPPSYLLSDNSSQPGWSPDGKQIAYTNSKCIDPFTCIDFELVISSPPGESVTHLTDLRHSFSTPLWSPDGKWIVLTDHDNSQTMLILYSIGEGRIQNILGRKVPFTWSSDSNWLLVSESDDIKLLNIYSEQVHSVGKGYYPEWQPVEVLPPFAFSWNEVADQKSGLIRDLSELKLDFHKFQNEFDLPAWLPIMGQLGYDEKSSQELLSNLSSLYEDGELNLEDAEKFRRLVMFEDKFFQLYGLESQVTDNGSESFVGVLTMVAQFFELAELLRNPAYETSLPLEIGKQIVETAVDMLNAFIQIVLTKLSIPQWKEYIKSSFLIMTEYVNYKLVGEASVKDILAESILQYSGDYLLLNHYVEKTQPYLESAVEAANSDTYPTESYEFAEFKSGELIAPLNTDVEIATNVHQALMESGELMESIGELSDLIALVTSPTVIPALISKTVSIASRSIATTEYAYSAMQNYQLGEQIIGVGQELPHTVFTPDTTPNTYVLPQYLESQVDYANLNLNPYILARISDFQIDSDQLDTALSDLLDMINTAERDNLIFAIQNLIKAQSSYLQDVNSAYGNILQANKLREEDESKIYAGRAGIDLSFIELYGSLIGILTDSKDEDYRTHSVQVVNDLRPMIVEYTSQLTDQILNINPQDLPGMANIVSIDFPDNLQPGQEYPFNIRLGNLSANSAKNAQVRISSEADVLDQPITSEKQNLNGQSEIVVRFNLSAPKQNNFYMVEALTDGEITDAHLLYLNIDLNLTNNLPIEDATSPATVDENGQSAKPRIGVWILLLSLCTGLLIIGGFGGWLLVRRKNRLK